MGLPKNQSRVYSRIDMKAKAMRIVIFVFFLKRFVNGVNNLTLTEME